VNIDTILKVESIFPRFISPKDNLSLVAEVTKEELEKIIHSFQKDKSPGPDGFPIDFYKGCFEI
jgi:hypothetical protein